MSFKYKVGDNTIPHFITFTIIGWLDVFTRECYKEIMVNSLAFCQKNKGLSLHAWIIMTNHINLIASSQANKFENLAGDIKKNTSKQIIAAMTESTSESRKEWMLNIFNYAGKSNGNNKDYQLWKQGNHPVELNTAEKFTQRLCYLHENPVRSGLVCEPWHYKYSSATDYYSNEKGIDSCGSCSALIPDKIREN